MKQVFVNVNGDMVDFDLCVNFMLDDLREDLHMELAPCTEQEFVDAYAERHAEKYGEDFLPSNR